MSEKITYACVTQNRIKSIKRNIPRIIDYVDNIVIVDGFSTDGTKEFLETCGPKVKVVQRQWDDSFARQYNRYLQEIKEGWIVICDDDEVPSEAMCKSFREAIERSNQGRNYDIVEYRCHDIFTDKDGNILRDTGPCDYWRHMLHRYHPDMKYIIDLHQHLIGHKYSRTTRRNDEYYHIKSTIDVARNACRNWFIEGVWLPNASSGLLLPEWHDMKSVIAECYPEVNYFYQLNAILEKGNIDKRLKDFFIKTKDIKDEEPNRKFHELRHYYEYYFDILHPEEKV